ncbi:FecR family protein [Sphingobacterium sp. LRF_L2]|uniref:FecR family protein n=1 Tax=Sphingobacterium sp. LRF_L2 TaxID=3369421 RepID=UPI003F60FAE4
MDRINPQLLKKYAEGRASEEECQKVEQWLEKEDNLFDDTLQTERLVEYRSSNPLSTHWRSFLRFTEEGARQLKIWWWGTRVVLPLLLLLVGVGRYLNQPMQLLAPVQEELMTLEIPKGQRGSIQLSDSTMVYLDGGSKLVYPKQFTGNERRISLEYGHAYLEVAKDTSKPFLLQTDGTQVKVLGTAFDVTNRLDDKKIAVILKEGAVEFSDPHGRAHRMKPGDKISYQKESGALKLYENRDVSYIGYWHTGSLQFEQSHLTDVLPLLASRFNVTFAGDVDAVQEIQVTGNFSDMPLKRILFLLEESTGVHFEENNKTIFIKK